MALLDIRTLLLVITVTLLARAVVLAYVWQIARNYRPLGFWTVGSALVAVGALLTGLRDIVAAFPSIAIAQGLLMTGWLLVDAGIVIAAERHPPWRTGAVAIVAGLAMTIWFAFFVPDYRWRTFAVTVPVTFFDLVALRACLQYEGKRRRTTLRLLAVALALLVASNAWKLVGAFQQQTTTLLGAGFPLIQSLLVALTFCVVVTVLFVLLAAQQLQEELDRDIAERKRVEAELAGYRDHLEGLVQARTAELEAAKEVAEAASHAKDAFLANMSHELRTPLNGIMGMTELALRRASDRQQIDYLTKAQAASRHLLMILTDILDVARIEAGRIDLSTVRFTVGEVMARVTDMLGPEASAKGLRLSLRMPSGLGDVALVGDPLRLGQVLLDLAGNAIKFTDEGEVTLGAAAIEDNAADVLVQFAVTDTGIGIADEDLPRLFAPFRQLDMSLTRRHGGSGLGLFIAKRLVETMGGSIDVDSAIGRGSSFRFAIRFARSGEAPDATVAAPGESAQSRLRRERAGVAILLVEDDPHSRELARAMLEQSGLKVDTAVDGREAVALAGRHDYAAILMDVKMPTMDGLAATRMIRSLPNGRAVPILATTAHAFAADRERCIEAGMNDYLAKPFEPEALHRMLLKWIGSPG